MFDAVNLSLAVLPMGLAVLWFFWRMEQKLDRMSTMVEQAIVRSTKEHEDLLKAAHSSIQTTVEEHREMTKVLQELSTNIGKLNGRIDLVKERLEIHMDTERHRT